MNLYKVEMSDNGGVFYVVAANTGQAQSMCEKQWRDWNYVPRKGIVLKIELVARGEQYTEGLPWLLIPGEKM